MTRGTNFCLKATLSAPHLKNTSKLLANSLSEALSYLLLENQMSHTSHASHTSHPLATFSSRYALHQASLKATLSATHMKGDWKLLVKFSSQSSSSFTSCHFCKFLVAKLKGGALRRLEPSGAAGWVAVVLHGMPGMRHDIRCA